MENEKKQLRLWQGLLVIILAGLEVFVFSDFLPQWLGMGRSLIGELILLGIAVGSSGSVWRKIPVGVSDS